MKRTWIAVCALMVPIIAQLSFANEKARTNKPAKPRHLVVHARTTAAKPVAVAKPSPPKEPWAGRNTAISESERHVIRAYVFDRVQASKGGKFNGVPQGLARKVTWGWGALPDGWEKLCVQGQLLHPEIHKHCQPLPHDVVVKLPPPPPGTVLLAVGGKVLRVAYPTYKILDEFDVR